jgi:hypothetical protein
LHHHGHCSCTPAHSQGRIPLSNDEFKHANAKVLQEYYATHGTKRKYRKFVGLLLEKWSDASELMHVSLCVQLIKSQPELIYIRALCVVQALGRKYGELPALRARVLRPALGSSIVIKQLNNEKRLFQRRTSTWIVGVVVDYLWQEGGHVVMHDMHGKLWIND